MSDTSALLHLRDGQLVRCPDAHEVWLTVVHGRVWVTQADDPDDHFLAAGQAMRIAPSAQAVVGAEGDAQVMVMPVPGRLDRLRRSTMGFVFRTAPVP
ncbi:MAG TPA: DUF2917 domain-containing protein [Albitalea sp.]|uniref:DUF2917 domain-containing protein n=1 Tax=Piscinibacter sp. TaxID=1903157 RepID=UPI002ED081B4